MILSNKSIIILYSMSLQFLGNLFNMTFDIFFQPLSIRSNSKLILQGFGFLARTFFDPKIERNILLKKSQCIRITCSLEFSDTCKGPINGTKFLIILLLLILLIAFLMNN